MDATREKLQGFTEDEVETFIRETTNFLNKFPDIETNCDSTYDKTPECINLFIGTHLLLNKQMYYDKYKIPIAFRQEFVQNHLRGIYYNINYITTNKELVKNFYNKLENI